MLHMKSIDLIEADIAADQKMGKTIGQFMISGFILLVAGALFGPIGILAVIAMALIPMD